MQYTMNIMSPDGEMLLDVDDYASEQDRLDALLQLIVKEFKTIEIPEEVADDTHKSFLWLVDQAEQHHGLSIGHDELAVGPGANDIVRR